MASVQNLLKNAVFVTASGNSNLWTATGGRFYYMQEIAGVSSPYVRYDIGSSAPSNVMGKDSPTSYDIPIHFDVFSSSTTATEAETIQSYIHAAFDGTALSISGYTDPIMRRGVEISIFEEETKFFHINITYWINVPKT